MKAISQALLNEQIQLNRKPAVKLQVQEYGYPAKSAHIRYSDFNWGLVHSNASTTGAIACCASDGSLLMTNATLANTANPVKRWANPTPDTDFSNWSTVTGDVPRRYYPTEEYDMIASPIDGEVLIIAVFWELVGSLYTPYFQYKRSTDYGVTWSGWIKKGEFDIYDQVYGPNRYAPYQDVIQYTIRGAFKSNGDVLVAYVERGSTGDFIDKHWLRRTGGVWGRWERTLFDYYLYTPMIDDMGLTAIASSGGQGSGCGGGGSARVTMQRIVMNVSLAHDGDFLAIYDIGQLNYLDPTKTYETSGYTMVFDELHQARAKILFAIYGDGQHLSPGSVYPMAGSINLAATDLLITSAQDLQEISKGISFEGEAAILWGELDSGMVSQGGGFGGGSAAMSTPQKAQGLGGAYAMSGGIRPQRDPFQDALWGGRVPKGSIKRDIGENTWGEDIAYSFLYKPPNYSMLLSTYDGKAFHIYKMRDDYQVHDGVFSSGEKFVNPLPVALCGNDTYLFAYNGNQLFISPQPKRWAHPTVGAGTGGYFEIDDAKIINVRESVKSNTISTLDIVLNNNDGYWDSPGAGDIDHLKKGSRLNLFLGYSISGADNTVEYQRYFVDTWGYTREPNMALFTLHCVDAWGLLNSYVFPGEAKWNQVEDSTDYSIYDIIEGLIESIGGTLSYINRSGDITSIYPRLTVRSGDTAANVLLRLLSLVPDQIKFFGNDGYIYLPKITDTSVYKYKFPVT